jgi:hypothetical protein
MGVDFRDNVQRLVNCCERVLSLKDATLPPEYFYQSLPLCVIDAVFSLGVKYEGTKRTVMRYCDYFKLQRIREDRETLPPIGEQDSMESLLERMTSIGPERFATEIFDNRQRTSTKSGILKVEAVLRFATVLKRYGVNYLQDVPTIIPNEAFEEEIRAIPGQTSGLALGYFFMLSGSGDFIKPDRMVLRFLERALGRRVSSQKAKPLVVEAASLLQTSYPGLTPRLLDNQMWKSQRGEKMPGALDSPSDKKGVRGVVTARKCPHCGHHEMGITTDEGEYFPLKPGMKIELS